MAMMGGEDGDRDADADDYDDDEPKMLQAPVYIRCARGAYVRSIGEFGERN
ncbi:GD18132 [Drosophila simulans]|uniref:GD18132 n=1 Tax=Drosophila simulans TaxID=7240 RepID=B4QWP0_DROSI|nr:GD18132 [Drosophila simulans]